MDLNGLKVTIFVEEGLAVYVVSRDMVLRDIDSANLDGSVQLSTQSCVIPDLPYTMSSRNTHLACIRMNINSCTTIVC